jgi:glycosyltransferase 2 family protein
MTDPKAQPTPAPKKRKSAWVRLLRAAIGLVILAVLYYLIPIGGVIDALRDARAMPVLGAVALVFVMQWATADRLRRLCDAHGHGWSTLEVLQINLATRFYGLFLPGGNFTGIAIRFYKLSGDHKQYIGTAVALFYDRVAATVTMCGVGAAFWLLERPGDSWLSFIAIVVAMAVMILALMVLFAGSPGLLISTLRQMVSRVGGVKLQTIREAVRASRVLSRRQTALIYLLSTLAHLLGILSWYLLCRALGLDISFITIGWVRSVVILATMIPLSVLGLGLREGAAVLLLTGYGVSQESALAFSALVLFFTVVLIGLAGGLAEVVRLLWRQH